MPTNPRPKPHASRRSVRSRSSRCNNIYLAIGHNNHGKETIIISLDLKDGKFQKIKTSQQWGCAEIRTIKDFDVIVMKDETSMALVSSSSDGYEGCFELWKIDNRGNMDKVKSSLEPMVPDKFSLYFGVNLRCIESTEKEGSIECLNILENIDSYLVRYNMDISKEKWIKVETLQAIANVAKKEGLT